MPVNTLFLRPDRNKRQINCNVGAPFTVQNNRKVAILNRRFGPSCPKWARTFRVCRGLVIGGSAGGARVYSACHGQTGGALFQTNLKVSNSGQEVSNSEQEPDSTPHFHASFGSSGVLRCCTFHRCRIGFYVAFVSGLSDDCPLTAPRSAE
jgi:hypothetical protein